MLGAADRPIGLLGIGEPFGRWPVVAGALRTVRLSSVLFDRARTAMRGKERRQLVELLALPAIGLMIVAVGALNLHAQENPRDFGRDVGRVAVLGHDQPGGAVLAHVAGGGDERAGDLDPRACSC